MSLAEHCPECGTEWGPELRSCPGCRRLVHAEELEALAARAKAARAQSLHADELEAWRSALTRLPPDSKQARRIAARVAVLDARGVEAVSEAAPKNKVPKWLAGLGAVGVFLWKAKAILAFVATKGKLLLTGLASWQTALSMLVSFGVYWAAWGWAFAAGLLLSLYLHEIGHVVALRRYGIAASAPMFVPGIGAFVRLEQYPKTPVEDARVGLAGPWAGLLAAAGIYGLHLLTASPLLAAVAQVGAWINLFNLVPIWQLDGGRAFRSLTRKQRWFVTGAVGAAWLLSGESLLILLLLAAGARSMFGGAPETGDRFGVVSYVALLSGLCLLAAVDVPVP